MVTNAAQGKKRSRRRIVAAAALTVLAVAMALGVVFRDRWAAGVLAWAARRATGWSVTARRLRVGLRPPRLQMEGFSVANPKGFPKGDAVRIRELYIEYDRAGSTPRETRLRELRLNLEQVAMIQRPDGTTNFDELMRTLPQERPPPRRASRQPPPPPPASPTPPGESAPPASSEETATPSAPPPPDSGEVPSPRAPAPPVETVQPPPPKTYRIERLAVTVGAVEFRTLLPNSDEKPLRITLNRTYVFTNVTDVAVVSNQLLMAMTLAATPQLFEEMLRGLMQ